MALLQKIKEKLGIGTGSTDRDAGETTVTVEKEAEAAGGETAETERTSAGTTPEPVGDADEEVGPDDESATDTADSASADPDTTADTSESPEPDAEPAAGGSDTEGATDAEGDPVEAIKGIGPAYGERLGEIGIVTVADLAAADAAEVAAGAKVGEKRAATWIQRAEEF